LYVKELAFILLAIVIVQKKIPKGKSKIYQEA